MACFESGTVVEMAAREAVTLQNVRGATLRVARGTIWLTQQDDGRDVILRVGDNYLVERDGATVIESQDGDAIVCVVGRRVAEVRSGSVHAANAPAWRTPDWRARLADLVAARQSFIPYV